jgi:hypothetical protein
VRGLFANEFQRDMQGLGPDPARIGRKASYAVHEALYALTNGTFNVECDEQAHSR